MLYQAALHCDNHSCHDRLLPKRVLVLLVFTPFGSHDTTL
jgi:hypothetical protein